MKTLLTALVSAAAAASFTAPAPASTHTDASQLGRYLSSMSWPVRASTQRASSVNERINDWLKAGDPPILGGIAATCNKFIQVDANSNAFSAAPTPPPLEPAHARLTAAYRKASAGCGQARYRALVLRDTMDYLWRARPAGFKSAIAKRVATTQTALRGFVRGPLHTFAQAVAEWRTQVRLYSTRIGAPTPDWLTALKTQAVR